MFSNFSTHSKDLSYDKCNIILKLQIEKRISACVFFASVSREEPRGRMLEICTWLDSPVFIPPFRNTRSNQQIALVIVHISDLSSVIRGRNARSVCRDDGEILLLRTSNRKNSLHPNLIRVVRHFLIVDHQGVTRNSRSVLFLTSFRLRLYIHTKTSRISDGFVP